MRSMAPVLLLACVMRSVAAGEVEFPWLCGGLCGSNMVLQRAPQQARLWGVAGAAPAGVAVEVTLNRKAVAKTTTAAAGDWVLDLPVQTASSGNTLNVVVGKLAATLENVAFGDVYLCGGQSNMEFAMPNVLNNSEEMAESSNYPDLRLFTVQQVQSETPLNHVTSKSNYTWAVSSPAALQGGRVGVTVVGPFPWFSAVCYFFGRETYKALNGSVPIGLIANPWGGTPVEAWSSPDALAKCPEGGQTSGQAPQGKSVLYNAMVVPLLPMRLTGEVWYQGEENSKYPAFYACRFPAMIADYRLKFGLPNMSFFYVELAAVWDNYSEIRRAQKHALSLGNVGFATAIDLGYNDSRHCMGVHSPRKQEVGRRISSSVQAIQYKMPVAHEGPTMEKVDVRATGSRISATVTMRSAHNLHVHGTASCGFRCKQQVQPQWQLPCCEESPFQVTYGSTTVRANYTLSSHGDVGVALLTADVGSTVTDPSTVYVSLQFEGFPQCALYNGHGGPEDETAIAATPFSTMPEPSLPSSIYV